MPTINKGRFRLTDVSLRQAGNDWPTAQVTTTSDVIESTSNLYFTNTRVVSALIAGQNIIIEANGRISSTSGAGDLTTADVRETSNLYYTNARVIFAAIPAVTELTVTTPVFNYNIDQYSGDNPAIYVSAGETIAFNLNVSGSHPFNIRVSNGGSNYDTGLTHVAQDGTISTESAAQGKVTGKLFWKIPYVLAGNTYVYQCSNHSSMVGSIVIQRPVSTITTDNVAEGSNLYYTNVRVFDALTIGTIQGDISASGNLIANGLIIRNINVSDNVLAGNITAGASVSNTIVADSITSNIWNGLYTANVIETSTNLYFTNARSRSAFTAGRGIIIMNDGTIKSTIGTETFNTAIDGGRDYKVTSAMGGLTFTSAVAGDRFLLRSLHVTNISDNTAYISSNVLYAGGNTAYMGNLIPVPVGSVVEFMDRPQIMQPGDTVNLQGFDQSLAPTSNILHSYFTFESINNDTTYVGVGQNLAQSNTNIQIAVADQSDTVFESIKFVNLQSYSIPVKLYFGSANGAPRSYLAYNMQVPPNSSMEMLQSPKLLKYLDVAYASYSNASEGDSIAVFSSYRRTAVTSTFGTTSSAVALGNIQASFLTTIPDGTTLYYTLE
jgi:plastocyanin